MKPQAFFNWSGGKDSALALFKTMQSEAYEMAALLTTVNSENMRISMHGVSADLLAKQAESIGVPLSVLELPPTVPMEEYETLMLDRLDEFEGRGIHVSVFGDIFLEDIRRFREGQLAKVGMQAVFPLWGTPTTDVMSEFLGLGFKAIVTCINAALLDESFVGRVIDEAFVRDLPENVDVCGENGEFHSFVFDGPLFSKPVDFLVGEKVYKEYGRPDDGDEGADSSGGQDDHPEDNAASNGFWFCDLVAR
ncbi:MAG: diphthine--ammonia ligase [Eggerthellaceae bacterium]|nr:diphthine--ammonia ligase [Eggerthellaceae bacterium]